MTVNCSFLSTFYSHHNSIRSGRPYEVIKDFAAIEGIWMSFLGLGKFETYQFVYNQCSSESELEQWIIQLKGERQTLEAVAAFEQWMEGERDQSKSSTGILDQAQLAHWKDNGFIKVSGLVNHQLCDAVISRTCAYLHVDLSKPDTWYNDHPEWHGLMVQLYQDENIIAIKDLPAIRQLFAGLYGSENIIANTEKVSFNPPETDGWKFRHSKLHWDIDFAKPDLYYIQGLVYLNDVPENRGPLKLVPGFHHQFEDWIKNHPKDPSGLTAVPVPGKKGDIVLWLQTLPHAASANHSDLPRFVQYISYTKI